MIIHRTIVPEESISNAQKITKAIAGLGGILVSCGTIHLEDINKGRIILKVRNVDHKLLTDALSVIEEIDIIDNRKAKPPYVPILLESIVGKFGLDFVGLPRSIFP